MIFEEMTSEQDELYRQALDQQQLLAEQAESWVLSVATSVKNIEAEIAAVESVLNPLKERLKGLQTKLDARKEYLTGIMLAAGLKSAKDGRSSVRLGKSEKVIIVDGAKIPSSYIITENVERVDKSTILRELKLGVVVDGCQLGETNFITIK